MHKRETYPSAMRRKCLLTLVPLGAMMAHALLPQMGRPAPTSAHIHANSYDDLLVLVDKTHALPSDYVPPDLVLLEDYAIPVTQAKRLGRLIMIKDLQKLFADSLLASIDLKVVSCYRSYERQMTLYTSYAQRYGTEQANLFSAQPGHSQHQLGTALDMSTHELGYDLIPRFAETQAGQWLLTNAHKYGFCLSYPQYQQSITGYTFEPWHYRYLGVEHATKLQQSDLNMETYLQQYGSSPQLPS